MAKQLPTLVEPSGAPATRNDSLTRHYNERRMVHDTWYNSRSRFGGRADPVIRTEFIRERARLKRAEAEALYEYDWVSRRVVDQMANDATREWIHLTHSTNPEKAEKLRQEDERLGGREVFEEAIRWSRLHGGNIMVLGAWDGRSDPEEPLELENVQKVAFAHNVDRWLAFPMTWYRDVEDPKYGTPETYIIHRLTPIGTEAVAVHESRTIRLDGAVLPPVARVRNWGWGASVLDAVYDAIRNWGVTNQAAASIIPNFITYKMKISNLMELIGNGEYAQIAARVGQFHAELSTHNAAIYGEGEDVEKMGTPVSGLDALFEKFMEVVAGGVGIPKSILFQAESGALGSNASQTDRHNWFNKVQAYQENYLRHRVRHWLDLIGIPLGLEPGEVEFEFNPLYRMTPEEEAELYYKLSQADSQYIMSGMVDQPERLAVFRFGGQRFNPSMPVFDTERMQKVIEEVDSQPVELGEGGGHGAIPEMDDEEGQEGEAEEDVGGGADGREGRGKQDSLTAANALVADDVERKVHRPGSRGGHIRGYDKRGNPIYGSPGHGMHGHSQAQQTKGKGKGGGREAMISSKSEPDQKAFKEAEQRGVKLPPAWTGVWVNPDKKADLQATGKDSKGRKQYVYSASARNQADAKKFARLRQFHKSLPAMQRRIAGDFDTRDEAKVLHLISQTGFRIGSEADTGGDKQAFGASTLRAEHATVDGDSVTFEFTGKKGVQQKHTVRDAGLARHVEQVGEGKLFNTDAGKVRAYLKSISGGKDFKVKDFRTYVATEEALKHVKDMPAPSTDAKRKKAVMDVARKVADKLGNTAQMARDSYIDPTVFKQWGAPQEAA